MRVRPVTRLPLGVVASAFHATRRRQKRRFKRPTDSTHSSPIAPNILDRQSDVAAPGQAWAGDVTYVATDEGWAYVAVILDLSSRRVIGWAISAANDTELALAALEAALVRAAAKQRA